MAYLLQIEGQASYDLKDGKDCKELEQHDAAEIVPVANNNNQVQVVEFTVKAVKIPCHVLVVEMKKGSGGRSDISAE